MLRQQHAEAANKVRGCAPRLKLWSLPHRFVLAQAEARAEVRNTDMLKTLNKEEQAALQAKLAAQKLQTEAEVSMKLCVSMTSN